MDDQDRLNAYFSTHHWNELRYLHGIISELNNRNEMLCSQIASNEHHHLSVACNVRQTLKAVMHRMGAIGANFNTHAIFQKDTDVEEGPFVDGERHMEDDLAVVDNRQVIEHILQGVLSPLKNKPRILIDVTATYRTGGNTGIQRVVSKLAHFAIHSGEGIPVIIENGILKSYYRHYSIPEIVEIADGDNIIWPDASWWLMDECRGIMESVSAKNGCNIFCLHDLIPIRVPYVCDPHSQGVFKRWVDDFILNGDAVICVSKAVADDFMKYLSQHRKGYPRDIHIGWWHPGGDFIDAGREAWVSADTTTMMADKIPYFLSVGTLEPRKGYSVVLDAFEKLWSEGCDIRYVISGKNGWNCDSLKQRLLTHPEFGGRLLWLQEVDDFELSSLYCHAKGVIFPSLAEGFGLPLVEALSAGTPVIASDIPVFREVGKDAVLYFRLLDESDLKEKISDLLSGAAVPTCVAPLSWKDSCEQFYTMVRHRTYQHRFIA